MIIIPLVPNIIKSQTYQFKLLANAVFNLSGMANIAAMIVSNVAKAPSIPRNTFQFLLISTTNE